VFSSVSAVPARVCVCVCVFMCLYKREKSERDPPPKKNAPTTRYNVPQSASLVMYPEASSSELISYLYVLCICVCEVSECTR
jgi:hypothetical protein